MSSDDKSGKPVWEGFVLLGLRLTRSLTEIAEIQTKRIEETVLSRADSFYTQREASAVPRARALHLIGSLFDDLMDRLRQDDEQ